VCLKKVQGRLFAAEAVTLSVVEGFYYTEEEEDNTELHRENFVIFVATNPDYSTLTTENNILTGSLELIR
jgi:hypothetical protein